MVFNQFTLLQSSQINLRVSVIATFQFHFSIQFVCLGINRGKDIFCCYQGMPLGSITFPKRVPVN